MQRSIRPETSERHGSIARRTVRALAGTLAAGLITGLMAGPMAGPALGANSVNQSVEPGTRSVVSDLSLDSVASAGADRIISGTLTVTVDDGTGTGAGWDVTISASALVNTSSPAAPEIPASSLALGAPETPVALTGQSVDAAHGPIAGTGGSLDAARTVVSAGRDHGMGTYTQSVPVTHRHDRGQLRVRPGAAGDDRVHDRIGLRRDELRDRRHGDRVRTARGPPGRIDARLAVAGALDRLKVIASRA